MRDIVRAAKTEGKVNSADIAFADLLQTLATVPSDELWTASTMASAAVQNGDVCVTLQSLADSSGRVTPDNLRTNLLNSGMVQAPEGIVSLPLVLDTTDRLYLSRYWQEECELAIDLKARLQSTADDSNSTIPLELLEKLFPTSSTDKHKAPDWQRVAAVLASQQRLSVITGGPGTGKTLTVARLLAVLMSQSTDTPRIALLAPTGKAAARLLESLQGAVTELKKQGIELALPATASTLHRALGYQPGRRGFRHNADNPLPFDLVLVDEASMVDLSMMHSLVSALTTETRLILLGDRDQLASVDAGNVLGDIVGNASPARYSPKLRDSLLKSCPGFEAVPADKQGSIMEDAVVELQHSYRFDAQSGIGHFARSVNAGDADAAIAMGTNADYPDLTFINPDQVSLNNKLLEQAVPAAIDVIKSETIEQALNISLNYRVLCALHHGPRGVEQINSDIESRLVSLGHMQTSQLWYQGRPILITRNDPGTKLYNGDTGLIWPDADGHMMAWFPDAEEGVRAIAPGRLPTTQTCFAMTVHKTQGSEFTNVLLVLPEPPQSLLSRDLLYTGITRARKVAEIYTSEEAVQVACTTKRVRASGLRDRLWGRE